MTVGPSHENHELNWLVNSFIQQVPGTTSAVVVSVDGLVLALSERLPHDTADTLAAVTSGLASLTAGAADCFDAGPVHQVIIEMGRGYLFVTTVSEGAALAVMCTSDCDIGLIGFEMTMLVSRVGQVLTPALRTDR